jgi:hypothetical protein
MGDFKEIHNCSDKYNLLYLGYDEGIITCEENIKNLYLLIKIIWDKLYALLDTIVIFNFISEGVGSILLQKLLSYQCEEYYGFVGLIENNKINKILTNIFICNNEKELIEN